MFLMCFYVFFNFVNRRTTFAFLNFWRFLASVSCQKTIFAAGRHPELTIWAIKAPTRRTKRFYKELDLNYCQKVMNQNWNLSILYLFYDISISGSPEFWRPEITTRRQSHRYRGRPKRGNEDFPTQSLSSLKYTFFIQTWDSWWLKLIDIKEAKTLACKVF